MTEPASGVVFLEGCLQIEVARNALASANLNPNGQRILTKLLEMFDAKVVPGIIAPAVCFEEVPAPEDEQLKTDVLASLRHVIQATKGQTDTILAAEILLETLELDKTS